MVLTKIYFLQIVLNRVKISLYLRASPIGKPEYLEMRRTYAWAWEYKKKSLGKRQRREEAWYVMSENAERGEKMV